MVTQSEASSVVITIALDVGADVGKLGSFTGRVRFDSLSLVYDGEVALGDGTVRASNREGGVIRVAGMSANGIDVERLAAFRFTVIDAAALRAVQFDVEEIHELSRSNVSTLVRRPTAGSPP